MEIDPLKAVDYVIQKAPEYAEAKANRKYLEDFKKVRLAQLYQEAPDLGTVTAKEKWAEGHEDIETIIAGIKEAVRTESELEWRMKAAMSKADIWRTMEASHRFVEKQTV